MFDTLEPLTLLHREDLLRSLLIPSFHHPPKLASAEFVNLHEITLESAQLFFAECERTTGSKEPDKRFVQT